MALRRLIFQEVIAQAAAPGDEAEQFARLGEHAAAAGIEILDGLAERGEIGADAGILVDRLDRPVEEAVGGAGRLGDLLAAHRGELIDLLAEFGRIGVERDQLVDEGVDLRLELGLLLLLQRHEARGLLGLDVLERRRRLQGQRGAAVGFGLGGHVVPRKE